MGIMRKLTAAGVVVALLGTTATPAMAGGYGSISIGSGYGNVGYGLGYGRGWGGRRHHHRDRVDTGDVIGAIAVIGVIAAIASAANKAKGTTRRDRDDDRYPERSDRRDDRRDDRGTDSRRLSNIANEDQAVDACAIAAEERAGQTASVRDITNVKRSNDGWDVEGVVEERDGWRDRSADKRRFTCSVRFGAVETVYIESNKVAFAD
jgi:hypothetical protein